MKLKSLALAVAAASALVGAVAPAQAQANEQFFPLLVYRTGPYAPNGTPWANGKQDYIKLVNAQGGINGVKIAYEECETGYATDKGVECYERLKSRPGVTVFDPQATGITFALTDKVPQDKIPLITLGYGLAASQDGNVFKWNFPLMGSYWTAADILIQHIGKTQGGMDKLKGKKIALVYHDSPYGKEPIPLLQKRAEKEGFQLLMLPVTAPGVEQKSTWLQIRQQRPDYVLLWSAGVMTPAAIREAQATNFPREKIYAIWWAGSDHDVKDIGAGAKGYNAATIHNTAERDKVHDDVKAMLYDKGQGTAKDPKELGAMAHTRGMVISMLQVEAIRAAQEKFGKGKVMTSEQVRWGYENLNLTQERLNELGFGKILRPIQTSCTNHLGTDWARIAQWDGSGWKVVSDWYQADKSLVEPLVKEYGERYAKEKNIKMRDCK